MKKDRVLRREDGEEFCVENDRSNCEDSFGGDAVAVRVVFFAGLGDTLYVT